MKRRIPVFGALFLAAALARAQVYPASVKIAVLPGSFIAHDLPTTAEIAAQMDEVVAIWNAASYGKTRFSYVVAEPVHIAATPGSCGQTWATEAANVAARAGITGDKYIFFQAYDPLCRYGGEAAVGGASAFVNANGSAYVLAHELGHMLGLSHARRAIFQGGVIGDFGNAYISEYGDPIDVLAGGDAVSAYERTELGWMTPGRGGRTSFFSHLDPITSNPCAVTVQRADGIEYWIERRAAGFFVRSSYFGSTWVATLRAGDVYRDEVGGVEIRAVTDADLDVKTFAPTIVPPPPPPPGPVIDAPTPGPTPCFVAQILPCTPTPGPVTATPTPTIANPTPVLSTKTPDASPTPTETSSPEPTGTPTPTATAVQPPPSTPTPHVIAVGSSGCRGKKNAAIPAEVMLLAGVFALRRFRKRSTPSPDALPAQLSAEDPGDGGTSSSEN